MKLYTRDSGLTLIELLIVVVIIAVLAASAVPNFPAAQSRSKVSRACSDLRTIAGANGFAAPCVAVNKFCARA